MAVLLHVSFTRDQLVSSYASEPILTFGAAIVWYIKIAGSSPQSTQTLIERRILPELRNLVYQEVLDTGRANHYRHKSSVRQINWLVVNHTAGSLLGPCVAKWCHRLLAFNGRVGTFR